MQASLTNAGNTRAELSQAVFVVRVTDYNVVPWKPVQQIGNAWSIAEPYGEPPDFLFSKDPFLEGGIKTRPAFKEGHVLCPDHIQGMDEGTQALWALGYIFYRDEGGVAHKTAFCRRYDATTRRFYSTGDTELEYEF
jgi:hypothetical protein